MGESMTNLEKLKKTFDELDIGYEVKEDENGSTLNLMAKVHKNVDGYSGFATTFYFDKDGKSIEVDIYE